MSIFLSRMRRRRTLLSLLVVLLLLSLLLPSTFAHGGIDHGAGDDDSADADVDADVDAHSEEADEDDGVVADGNIGLGFGMAALSAVCSAIGAATPFLDDLFPYIPALATFRITESRLFLAGALALSSGVLLFLSLTDLYPEAIGGFADSDLFDKKYSGLVAAAIFIATALLIVLARRAVAAYRKNRGEVPCLCDPEAKECLCDVFEPGRAPIPGHVRDNECACAVRAKTKETDSEQQPGTTDMLKAHDKTQLSKLAYQIAIALAVHNFPEGLALFATAIESARLGTMFGIALALHKFPEGVCMSVPLYYSTGSRWKAFIIPAIIGVVSQMAGACLGYALFVTVWNSMVSGVLFTVVTTVLLYTILHGMLPMARKYDPTDRTTTYCLFIGMAFFAIVSGLFALSGEE